MSNRRRRYPKNPLRARQRERSQEERVLEDFEAAQRRQETRTPEELQRKLEDLAEQWRNR